MEYTDDTEDFNEWQQIEQQHPSPTVHQSSVAWNTAVINENYLHFHADQSSSEGSLQIVPTTIDSDDGNASPSAPPPSDWRFLVANEGRKLLKLRFEAMRARVAYKVRNCVICMGAFWSITCVTGAAAAAVLVSLVYMGIRRRRRRVCRQSVDHLVYLLREKDEKISQLLLQVAQLNEVLSSRRKVPVLRISS